MPDESPAPRPARTRAIALIGVPDERRAPHTASFPLAPEKMLPDADVVLLVADDDPGAMLFRYSAYGELAGDTWHPSADDARGTAAEEYGDALQPWVEVPDDVADAHHFAVRYAAERLNDREGR
ncbi:hypothetical protein [Roseisolibacter sp. H3M3-2]|uniref:hypothetical protein n=1 Tax=Roseisolibacter sp. H3M3-2 TaxID=3031323 RepID=UPI0023DA9035|nr:hypothetical protein [Roseisolibacter sp. H3M3-2]MDF1502485.1 hypothetical protein [Roseisolibacter sp. H3M3-2]